MLWRSKSFGYILRHLFMFGWHPDWDFCNLINYRESARNCDLRYCVNASSFAPQPCVPTCVLQLKCDPPAPIWSIYAYHRARCSTRVWFFYRSCRVSFLHKGCTCFLIPSVCRISQEPTGDLLTMGTFVFYSIHLEAFVPIQRFTGALRPYPTSQARTWQQPGCERPCPHRSHWYCSQLRISTWDRPTWRLEVLWYMFSRFFRSGCLFRNGLHPIISTGFTHPMDHWMNSGWTLGPNTWRLCHVLPWVLGQFQYVWKSKLYNLTIHYCTVSFPNELLDFTKLLLIHKVWSAKCIRGGWHRVRWLPSW